MNGRESLSWVPLDNVASSRFLRNTCLTFVSFKTASNLLFQQLKLGKSVCSSLWIRDPKGSSSWEWLLFTLHSDHPDEHCFCWQLSSLPNPTLFSQSYPDLPCLFTAKPVTCHRIALTRLGLMFVAVKLSWLCSLLSQCILCENKTPVPVMKILGAFAPCTPLHIRVVSISRIKLPPDAPQSIGC